MPTITLPKMHRTQASYVLLKAALEIARDQLAAATASIPVPSRADASPAEIDAYLDATMAAEKELGIPDLRHRFLQAEIDMVAWSQERIESSGLGTKEQRDQIAYLFAHAKAHPGIWAKLVDAAFRLQV